MKKKLTAGILLYRLTPDEIEVFPGPPRTRRLEAAIRQFKEVAGFAPEGPFLPLTPQKLKKGRQIYAWASPGNLVPALVRRTAISITITFLTTT